MKKKDIITLINLNKELTKLSPILKRLEKNKLDYNNFTNMFPKIDNLNSEFEILKIEMEEKIEHIKKLEENLKANSTHCNHQVRLEHHMLFCNTSRCVLCGKYFNGDNCNNANTIYNSENRNRQTVFFRSGYYSDDENYDWDANLDLSDFDNNGDSGGMFSGKDIDEYSRPDVFNIIERILKDKNDDDEVDFTQELKKMRLKGVRIDERDFIKEYYILVIGGSNKRKIDDISIGKDSSSTIYMDLAYILSKIPFSKIEILGNKEHFETKECKDNFKDCSDYTLFQEYETIDELNKLLNSEKDVPFDFIIDASELLDYDIEDNKIKVNKTLLNLKDIFKNSKLINISNYNKKNKIEILNYIKEYLTSYDYKYGYNKNELFKITDSETQNTNTNEICKELKKELKK